MEQMSLDLVDGRRDLVLIDQVDQPIHREVRDPDGPDSALPLEFLHRPPLAVVVAEGLVNQVQVDIVKPRRCSDFSKARLVLASPASWTQSLVVVNRSWPAMLLLLIA